MTVPWLVVKVNYSPSPLMFLFAQSLSTSINSSFACGEYGHCQFRVAVFTWYCYRQF